MQNHVTQIFTVELFADYFQIYLCDESSNADLSNSWDDNATQQRMAIGERVVGIRTAHNTNVSVSVEVLDDEPQNDIASWNHVTETSLDVPSGRIVIAGGLDFFPDSRRIEVLPDCYKIRVSYNGIDSVCESELSRNDYYRVQIWPGAQTKPVVLKWHAA
jgi:hypothetical protein